MTRVSILFPSSYPQSSSKIEDALEALRPHERSFSFDWPRPIRARKKGDSTDYLAGSDAERCEELITFLQSPGEVAWFGRGGYGMTRIVPLLAQRLQDGIVTPKRWMGYSDITALFALCKTLSLPVECIHGPMLCAFPTQPNKGEVLGALRGEAAPIPFTSTGEELEFHGSMWGGNLAVLASLAGTPWLPVPSSDTAVFLEDIDEAPYRVDRYLTQLFHAGFFAQTKKVVFGTFTGFDPASAVYEVAQKRCHELGLDLLGRIPVGHSEPHSPLFLDKPYRYSPSEQVLAPNF